MSNVSPYLLTIIDCMALSRTCDHGVLAALKHARRCWFNTGLNSPAWMQHKVLSQDDYRLIFFALGCDQTEPITGLITGMESLQVFLIFLAHGESNVSRRIII